jgi:hypothetical protein
MIAMKPVFHSSGTSISPALMASMTSCGFLPSIVQPTDCAVPRISLATPERSFARDFERIVRAISKISSRAMLPECLMFFSFFRSRGGSGMAGLLLRTMAVIIKRTFESLNDKGRCGGYDGNSSLSILNGELNSDPKTLPRRSCFCDIFSNFLWRLYNPLDLKQN